MAEVSHQRFGDDPGADIAANVARVREQIAEACRRVGRLPEEVRLLPVSKTVPASILRAAAGHGVLELGENKVQEAREKHQELSDLPIRWNVIGNLQANKAKYVARFAHEFQALDSVKVASVLNERLAIEQRQLDVLVQVNTSGEDTKFGLRPEEVLSFLQQLPSFPHLKVKGLMTLAAFSEDTDWVRRCFSILRELRDEVQPQVPEGILLHELSMGMSGDFTIAIEEGSTVVRVGRAIFGGRPGSDAHYWPGLIPG